MSVERPNLKAIDGGRPADRPRAGKRLDLRDSEQVTCWQCLALDGVETSIAQEVILAPRRAPDGSPAGGTPALICAFCLAKGRITNLFPP